LSLDTLLAWIENNQTAAMGLGAFSIVTFLGTLALVPFLIARIPPDYFTRRHREHDYRRDRHPLVHHLLVILKNLLGAVLFVAGVVMLVLPGQGVLTILLGVMLMDFPGKFRLEQRLLGRPSVLKSINWIRAKAHQPPLETPTADPPTTP
jgi:Putative transmembrane protein (PGPGW)